MSRYEVIAPWEDVEQYGDFLVQNACIRDKQTGTEYCDGAYRVMSSRTGKPAKTGRGGTVPFYGESAWCDAERLARDLQMQARRSA